MRDEHQECYSPIANLNRVVIETLANPVLFGIFFIIHINLATANLRPPTCRWLRWRHGSVEILVVCKYFWWSWRIEREMISVDSRQARVTFHSFLDHFKFTSLFGCLSVWPDFAKFRQFRKFYMPLAILKVDELSIWKNTLSLLCQIYYAIRKIFNAVDGQVVNK